LSFRYRTHAIVTKLCPVMSIPMSTSYIDPSLILYAAFFVLFIMRGVCGWKCCGMRFEYTNYCSLLYFIVIGLCMHAIVRFLFIAFEDHYRSDIFYQHPDANIDQVHWLRWFIWGCPFALILSIVLCVSQTRSHIEQIFKDKAVLSHDRAIQIIAIPAVFGTMMLNGIVPVYKLVASADHSHWEVDRPAALQRFDSCFFVADLYEAWALYQFGMLTLEQVNASLHRRNTRNSQSSSSGASALLLNEELLMTHGAVAQLMWMGVFMFIIVCMAQAGYALILQIAGGDHEDSLVEQFEIAGLIVSGAAIFNVYVVESTFHKHLENYRPRLKFISVKILVSLAFFQRGTIIACQTVNSWQPTAIQGIVRRVPAFGDILNMSSVQMALFYPALLIYECLISAMLHSWAWNSDETWYDENEALMNEAIIEKAGEKQPLLDSKLPAPNPFSDDASIAHDGHSV